VAAVESAAAEGGAIRNIVFDIGWVLVRLDYRPILAHLAAHGATVRERDVLMDSIALTEHECGRMCGQGLIEKLAALAPRPPPLAATAAHWLNMFEVDPAMVELAHRLSERYRVYLLSNIGDLHWAQLMREFRLHTIGHGALPSYLAGCMKPHADIYAEAERRFALTPAATVFIDDRADNIAAATARGWHGIVHRDFAGTRAALRELAVHC
jgi:FMN phosphatase YigB (HAD superfamily)